MVPCVTGNSREWLLLMTDASTVFSFLICLTLIPGISRFDYDDIFLNPPIFRCFPTANETLAGNVCILNEDGQVAVCGHRHIRLCLDQTCLDSVRYCSSGEEPWDLFKMKVMPVLIVVLCDCLALGAILQWMSNYLNVYKYTKWIRRGNGYIHRSLLCTAVQEGDHNTLENVLAGKNKKRLCEMISRPNKMGNTPLHIAVAIDDCHSVQLLIKNGGDTAAKNARGECPLHVAAKV